MKKKLLVALLTATVVATLVTGCGTPTETSGNVANNTQTEEVIESDVVESVDATVDAIVESVEDTEVVEESEVESTEEVEGTEVQEEAEATEESTETEVEENVETEVTETEAEAPVVEEPAATETEVVEEAKVEYTYKDMDATMYAKSAVNVRDLPSTHGNRVGSLSGGQEVKVTGQCNETGWYRLDSGNYVSNNYLVSTKPAPAPSVSTPAEGTAASTATTQDAYLANDFISILNAKRAEQGLSQVSLGDSSLQNEALNGAIAISTNMSHSALSGGHDVANIAAGQTSAQQVFNDWYASDGHRVAMMDSTLETVACANYNGYWVFVGRCKPITTESIQEQIASGEMEHVGSTDVGNGQTVDVYVTEGADATNQYSQEELDNMASQWESQWEEQLKQMGY